MGSHTHEMNILGKKTLVKKHHSNKKNTSYFKKEGKKLKSFELSSQLGLKFFVKTSISREKNTINVPRYIPSKPYF
jgi:hypothetical protein